MKRVFLDANVLFSAAWRADAGLLRLWKMKGCELLNSHYPCEEARRKLPTPEQQQRLALLLTKIRLVPDITMENFPAGIVLPKKDRPILLAAIGAKPDFDTTK